MLNKMRICFKVCPRCKTSIKTTLRYSDYIKRNMKDIMKVKSKCYGSVKENGKLRQELLSKIPRSFRIVHGKKKLLLSEKSFPSVAKNSDYT